MSIFKWLFRKKQNKTKTEDFVNRMFKYLYLRGIILLEFFVLTEEYQCVSGFARTPPFSFTA